MVERSSSKLVPIGEIISYSMDRGFLGLAREMVRVFKVWDEAVGAFNAARTRPESIKDGHLNVLVESPVWIDQLGYFKAEFIEKINQALGADLVREIHFRVASISKPSPPAGSGEKPPDNTARLQDDHQIQNALSNLKDPDLKNQLAAFLARQAPRREE